MTDEVGIKEREGTEWVLQEGDGRHWQLLL